MAVTAINSSRKGSWTVPVDTFVPLAVKDLVSIESHCGQ